MCDGTVRESIIAIGGCEKGMGRGEGRGGGFVGLGDSSGLGLNHVPDAQS